MNSTSKLRKHATEIQPNESLVAGVVRFRAHQTVARARRTIELLPGDLVIRNARIIKRRAANV